MWTGLFGLCSNLFVIVVIVAYRPMRERVTNLYLINQSMIDASVATFLFLTTLLQDNKRQLTPGRWSDEALCRLWFTKMPLWGLLVSSTYSLVSLTLERFLAVVYPLRHRAWCSRRTVSSIKLVNLTLPNDVQSISRGSGDGGHAFLLIGGEYVKKWQDNSVHRPILFIQSLFAQQFRRNTTKSKTTDLLSAVSSYELCSRTSEVCRDLSPCRTVWTHLPDILNRHTLSDAILHVPRNPRYDAGFVRRLNEVVNIVITRSHGSVVVWECCKDDRQSQWEMAKFDPQPTLNP